MRYHYISRDAISPITWVRRASKQAKTFAVLADESPSGDNRQVLLMSGRQGRERIPIVLNSDSSVSNIVGSALARVQGERLVGVLAFASDPAAQSTMAEYESGKLQLSLVTKPLTAIELKRGESFLGHNGPCLICTEWSPLQIVLS